MGDIGAEALPDGLPTVEKHRAAEWEEPLRKIEAGDPESRSADVVADNLERLKALFPEAFADGRIDFEVLKQLLGGAVDDPGERYGLNWHGKRRALWNALMPSTGTLRPCPQESVDWETTRNVVIEGDNLEVLKLLQKSYAGKVKLIYIDPPYNTGNDFVYPDDWRDGVGNYLALTGQADGERRKLSSNPETSGRFHTAWLNMMYPRLKLARSLVCNDGAIVISIDEHEFFNIRNMLNEIFGEENLVSEICVSLNPKGRQLTRFFATSHEYIVIYARDIELCSLNAGSKDTINESDFPYSDTHGDYRLLPLRNTNKKFNPDNRPNLYYALHVDESTGHVSCNPASGGQVVYPVFGDGSPAVWRWSKSKVQKDAAQLHGRVVRGHSGNRLDVFQKDYLTEERTKKLKTVWSASEVGSTDSAVAEMKELVGPVFNSPKPAELLKALIRLMPPDSLVMDFFAGSGTTGHAVMEQNAADGGRRRYILVQLPEPLDPANREQKTAADFCDRLGKPRNIAELTKERLRRAAGKVRDGHPAFAGDLGFRVFKLDSSNIRAWDPDPDDLEGSLLAIVNRIKEDRSDDDIFHEILLKFGYDLSTPVETRTVAGKCVRSVGGGLLIVCLDEALGHNSWETLAEGIAQWHVDMGAQREATAVFRDNAFGNDVVKLNVVAILEQSGLTRVYSL